MQDFDLEELETALYSQVFHSAPEHLESNVLESDNLNTTPNQEKVSEESEHNRQVSYPVSNVLHNRNRYWNSSKSKNQIGHVKDIHFTPQNNNHVEKQPAVSNNQASNVSQPEPIRNDSPIDERNTRNRRRRNRKARDFHNNKYGAMPRNTCQKCPFKPYCACNTQDRNFSAMHQNLAADPFLINRIFTDNVQLPTINPSPVLYPFNNVHEVNSEISPVHNIEKVNEKGGEIIILSDSDDDSVILVPQESKPPDPVYVIDSDSEVLVDVNDSETDKISENNATGKSVSSNTNNIQLETENKEPASMHESDVSTVNEIISNIEPVKEELSDISDKNFSDDEFIKSNVKENEKYDVVLTSDISLISNSSQKDKEIDSRTNLEDKKIISSETISSQEPVISESERNEMICTPDSAVNDFIETDVNDECQFNFNLHGSDLDLTGKEFTRPIPVSVPACDIYETESSCSGTGTPTKGSVYNEFAHNTPVKDIFHEPNLTSFSNFITPKNNKKRKQDDENLDQVPTKALEYQKEKSTEKDDEVINFSSQDISNSQLKKSKKQDKLKKQRVKEANLKTELENVLEELYKHKNIDENFDKLRDFRTSLLRKKKKRLKHLLRQCKKKLVEINKKLENVEVMFESEAPRHKVKKHKKVLRKKKLTVQHQNWFKKKLDIIDSILKERFPESDQNDAGTQINLNENNQEEDHSEEYYSDKDSDDTEDILSESEYEKQKNPQNSVHKDMQSTSSSDSSEESCVNNIENIENDVNNDNSNTNDITLNISTGMTDKCSIKGDRDESPVSSESSKKNVVRNPFHKRYTKTFQDYWTTDMNTFYDESWGQEDFDINAVIESMSADDSKWKIIDEDKPNFRNQDRRKYCVYCKEHGHYKINCPKYRKAAVRCSTCGAGGHSYSRCPNLVCTTCGFRGGYHTTSCEKCAYFGRIQCNICYMWGHPSDMCPDLWRRYHSTIAPGPPSSSPDKLKPQRELWCSGCASRGHLYHECKRVSKEHFPTLPHVVSYDPAYDDDFRYQQGRNSGGRQNFYDPQIPQLNNMRLSALTRYRETVVNSNTQKYGYLIKSLIRKCQKGPTFQYLDELRSLERDLQRNNFDTKKIATMYKLRSLIRRHDRIFL